MKFSIDRKTIPFRMHIVEREKIQYRSQENWIKMNRKNGCRLLLSSLADPKAEYSHVTSCWMISSPVGLLKCPCGSFSIPLNISDCTALMLWMKRRICQIPQCSVVSQKVKDSHSLTCQNIRHVCILWTADRRDQDNSKSKENYLNDKMNILRTEIKWSSKAYEKSTE